MNITRIKYRSFTNKTSKTLNKQDNFNRNKNSTRHKPETKTYFFYI